MHNDIPGGIVKALSVRKACHIKLIALVGIQRRMSSAELMLPDVKLLYVSPSGTALHSYGLPPTLDISMFVDPFTIVA